MKSPDFQKKSLGKGGPNAGHCSDTHACVHFAGAWLALTASSKERALDTVGRFKNNTLQLT